MCIFMGSGCPADPMPVRTSAQLRDDAYRAPSVFLERARFLKPAEGSAPADVIAMAPLLVQEPSTAERNIMPVVYFEQELINLKGQSRRRLYFICFHPIGHEIGGPQRATAARLTLDANGFSMIAEVYESDSAIIQIYVSRSLEEAARKQYGTPLPQRRHVIEASIEAQPRVVVPRILEDGPQPMGPYIYLNADLKVITLLCRCSPSQVRDFVENTYYPLRQLDELRGTIPSVPVQPFEIQPAFPETADPVWLTRALRLPNEVP